MSVFTALRLEQVVAEPFPHLVVENALDQALCDELVRAFPPLTSFTKGRRCRDSEKIHSSAVDGLNDPQLSPTWKNFLRDHVAPESFADRVRLFGSHARREYPDFEQRFGPLDRLRTGVRWRDRYDRCDVLLDAQLSIHTPITRGPAWDRGPHVKMRDKLFVALLFLRAADDESQGADWELYSLRPGVQPKFDGRHQTIDHRFVRLERLVPYRRNTLVMFLNTSRSIQGWSLRTPSHVPFQYVVLSAQMPEKLFDLGGRLDVRLRRSVPALARRMWGSVAGSP